MKRFLLDESAMLVFLEDRPGAQVVEELLERAMEKRQRLLMTVTSLGELYRLIGLRHGEAAANDRIAQVGKLPLEIVDVDMNIAKLAGALSCRLNLDFLQCLPAAAAQTRKATLVSCDTEVESSREIEVVHAGRPKECAR